MTPEVAAGTLTSTSYVLPAAIKTSVCTRGAAGTMGAPGGATLGRTLPSSAIKVNPATVAAAPAPLNPRVNDPTIEGTCIRGLAFTRRARMVPLIPVMTAVGGLPVTPAVAWNNDIAGLVLLNATPLMR